MMGRGVVAGLTDLASLRPDLASQWHPTKNGSLSPMDVSPGSNKRVWWQCSVDPRHEWDATVSNRTVLGRGCPVCSGRRVLAGVNDLATLHPEVVREWHPTKNGDLTPEGVTAGSKKRVWWKCAQGHEWLTDISGRVSRGSGCPYCSGRFAVAGKTDLATTHPEIAAQWHPTKNGDRMVSNTSYGAHYRAWWIGVCGHEWDARVHDRCIRNEGCPFCAGKRVLAGFNDLASVRPDLASQWHPTRNIDLSPHDVVAGSAKEAWWQCEQGHEWKTTIVSRTVREGSAACPTCSGRQVLAGFNDLATVNPILAREWHPTKNGDLTPDQVRPGSNKKVWWQCSTNPLHEWRTTVLHRSNKRGCPFCTRKRVQRGDNDLATMRPDLATQWHPTKNGDLTPADVTAGSDKKVWWQCDNNAAHEWETWVYARHAGNGCPECAASAYVSSAETDLYEVLRTLLPSADIMQSNRTALRDSTVSGIGTGELDIYLPEQKFAVEFNGLYWHSEAFKDKEYHYNKTRACEAAGITLLHIWEDDWRERRSIVIRGLAHRLGATRRLPLVLPDEPVHHSMTVGARQCVAGLVDIDAARAFLDTNHIQGFAPGTKYFGLRDRDGILRAVMVIKKTARSGEYRIERYATAGVVQGGFTKLLKYAETCVDGLRRWITFSDSSLSNGGLYASTGFVQDGVIKPDYSYIVDRQRIHKFNYRLARFRKDPDLRYEEGLSERELAQLNGLYRIWDAGKIRWTKEVS